MSIISLIGVGIGLSIISGRAQLPSFSFVTEPAEEIPRVIVISCSKYSTKEETLLKKSIRRKYLGPRTFEIKCTARCSIILRLSLNNKENIDELEMKKLSKFEKYMGFFPLNTLLIFRAEEEACFNISCESNCGGWYSPGMSYKEIKDSPEYSRGEIGGQLVPLKKSDKVGTVRYPVLKKACGVAGHPLFRILVSILIFIAWFGIIVF